MVDDLVGQIVHIDDGFADAGVTELVEHMIEQRAARHADQRLRHPVRQRTHAHTEACGEHHGFAGFDGHFLNFLEPHPGYANHITAIRAAHRWSALAALHDGCATTRVGQTSAGARLAAFFFLSPCFRKLTPI